VHKEVLWIISNITIGTPEQINAAVVHNNRYATLLTFANSDNTEVPLLSTNKLDQERGNMGALQCHEARDP
jgi:hypothetical protein